MEQKKINETTEKISKMVVKISGRIVSLQHHVKELKKLQKNYGKLHKLIENAKFKVENSITENLNENFMANQCTIMMNKLMSIFVTVEQKEILVENDQNELNEIMDNFNCLMKVFFTLFMQFFLS